MPCVPCSLWTLGRNAAHLKRFFVIPLVALIVLRVYLHGEIGFRDATRRLGCIASASSFSYRPGGDPRTTLLGVADASEFPPGEFD